MKNDDRFGELEALDSWQLVHDEQDIRGCTVASVTGTHYGTIEDMLVDKEKEHVAAVRLDDGRIVAAEFQRHRCQLVSRYLHDMLANTH